MTLLSHLVGVALRPSRTFEALDGTERHGPWAALLTGVAWSLFITVLFVGGHQPSGPLLLPIPRAAYYAWEASLAVPTYFLMFLVFSGVIRTLGKMPWRMSQTIAGSAMAVSSICAFLIPDVIVYFGWGFGAIGTAMRFYGPVSAGWGMAIVVLALRARDVSNGRAAGAALAGWIAHMTVGALVLR